jgi:hypothetical protein
MAAQGKVIGGAMSELEAERTPPAREETRRRYFGPRLRELRETYAQRIDAGRSAGPLLRATPSAQALLQCMERECDFSISGAAYNEIENGANVPRDAVGFLNAVAVCLRLGGHDKADLARRLAYDLVANRLRDLTSLAMEPEPDW